MPIVVVGMLALAGYVTVRRALDSTVDTADLDPAIDITVLESAVEENGLRAVADTDTLEAAINDDELDSPVDIDRLQSTVEEKLTTVERAVDAGDIESVLDADELDAATDRGLSAITEQEIVEGTIEGGEIGVSVDTDELRSVLESGAGILESTSETIAEKIIDAETGGSLLDAGRDEPIEGGQRIAVVDEQGNLESVVDENEPDTADTQSQSIEIEDGDDRTDETDPINGDQTDED